MTQEYLRFCKAIGHPGDCRRVLLNNPVLTGDGQPQEYHEEVYDRLNAATLECRGVSQCQNALVAELRALAEEINTEGSKLNKLITKSSR